MKDLTLNSTLPVITGNFDEIKLQLQNELKQYDLIVDGDSIKEAKKMATQINKVSGNIDALRKEKVSELSAPIDAFVKQAKELTDLCQDSRSKLLSQVKVFEDKQREQCREYLNNELIITYKKYGVNEEFQTVMIDDLAIISNLTTTGLAKKARNEVDERVLERKNFQEKIDTRLLTLEGDCFKAGLQAPLTRENISYFLMESSDEVYKSKLQSLIVNEISRIEIMNERLKEKSEAERAVRTKEFVSQEPIEEVQAPILKEEPLVVPEKYGHFKNVAEFAPVQKKEVKASYTVTATFEIELDEKYEDKIEGMLIKRLSDASFKAIPTIKIVKGISNESSRIRA